MEPIETAIDKGVWAIVMTAGGNYIGQIDHVELPEWPSENVKMAIKDILVDLENGCILTLNYPQEYQSMLIPQPTPQGVHFNRMIQAYSIGRCLDIEATKIHLTPENILFLNDMSVSDRAWYKELIMTGIRTAVESRAQAAGILTPGHRRGANPGHAGSS
jgi:hypothetical protein